jgi:hypothetical protein
VPIDLFLRQVRHPQARDNYRVIAKVDGDEIEIGSVGVRLGAGIAEGWTWGIDTVVVMRSFETEGTGKDRTRSMKQFRAAWDRLASDPARLIEFLAMKRARSRSS